jgi:hypothetical protein
LWARWPDPPYADGCSRLATRADVDRRPRIVGSGADPPGWNYVAADHGATADLRAGPTCPNQAGRRPKRGTTCREPSRRSNAGPNRGAADTGAADARAGYSSPANRAAAVRDRDVDADDGADLLAGAADTGPDEASSAHAHLGAPTHWTAAAWRHGISSPNERTAAAHRGRWLSLDAASPSSDPAWTAAAGGPGWTSSHC